MTDETLTTNQRLRRVTRKLKSRAGELREGRALLAKYRERGEMRNIVIAQRGINDIETECRTLTAERDRLQTELAEQSDAEAESALQEASTQSLADMRAALSHSAQAGTAVASAAAVRQVLRYSGGPMGGLAGLTESEVQAARQIEDEDERERRKSPEYQQAVETKRAAGGMYGL